MDFYFLFFLLKIVQIVKCNEFKLSDSKILLPRTSFLSINYTIRGSNTICHEWFSGTPEVITVTPIFPKDSLTSKCSHEAIITSVWQSNHRATATIYAKNIATSHEVKCDVIVDNIDKINIETRTLELYLHETPEALIAKAIDEYGNTFSTLDGIPFEWSIHASAINEDGQNVIRFITWTESEYITPTLIGALEQQGLQGYMQLVSGLKTGAARVSLVFRDDKLKTSVKSSEIRMLVMANAALSPPLAYVIPYTQLSYKVLVHSQGATQQVKMPNSQYFLKINNTELAVLDKKGSTVTAKKVGQTEVILIDKNINEDFRHPSSILYVVEPGFLTFYISPGENQWVLQSGNEYVITVRPFDFNSHQIHMSDNLRLETRIPTEYFEILFSTKNGTYNVVRALKEGNTVLKSNFSFILLQNGTKLKLDNDIEGSQGLVIYPPIIVFPSSIVIPWYPNGMSVSGYQFKATGGSGEYKWMVSNSAEFVSINSKSSLCSVSIDLTGHIKPLEQGIAYVIAADQRNLINRGISVVSVDTIYRISFLINQVEVEINHELLLPLKAVNSKNETMSHCHWLPFELSVADASKIEIIEVVSSHESNIPDACALLKIRGRAPGFSKVALSLVKLQNSKSTQDFLTTSITIGAYRPTKFIDNPNGLCTIGILSMKTFHIIDGPLPWTLDPSKYFYKFNEDDESKRLLKKIKMEEDRLNSKFSGLILQVQCIEIGEVDISITIGNKPSLKNPNPASSVGHIKLSCTVPVFMKLVPRLMTTNVSIDCPYENDTDVDRRITVNNKKPMLIEVTFTDRNGYQLERSESFNVNVEITTIIPKQIARNIVEHVQPKVEYSKDNSDHEQLPARSYFYVTPKQPGRNTGDIQIKATSNSYRLGNGPAFHLESKLTVRISKSMVVEPEKLILYHHENISGKITVKFGSGHFIVLPPSPDFLKVNLLHKSVDNNDGDVYEVIQTKVDKSQRNGLIQIVDTCFNAIGSESENSKSIPVEMVRPFKIQLLSLNKLQLGSQIHVLLQVFDDTGREFPSEYLHMLQFSLIFHDNFNIISAHSSQSKEWIVAPCEYSQASGLLLKITGEKIGFTSFSVLLKQNKDIASNVQKIEVFPPLKLTPKHTVLLESTELQLSSTGGPTCCQDMLHFTIIPNNTLSSKQAKIQFIKGPNGLIRGITHGSHAVMVRIEISDADPVRGNQLVVLSKDEGLVGVVQINTMSIYSPTNKLIAGNSMPLWIVFTSSFNDLEHLPITGFSLAGQKNDLLAFKWSLNPPQGVIANLGNFLEPAGIHIGNKYLHSGMRISSLNPGKLKIEVSVSGLPYNWLSKNINRNEPLISKLNIAIIPRLEILEPVVAVRKLLLPPSSRITLKSSLDNDATVSYSLTNYEMGQSSKAIKSKIHSGNILETSHHITSNEEEQFVLNIKSSQPIKLNAANEAFANQSLALFVTVKHPVYSMLNPYIYGDSIFQKFQYSKDSNYNSDIAFLPLGGPFIFRITNHDELGNIFDVSPDSNSISYHLHRTDNLAVSIATEDLSKLSPAQDLSMVSDKKITKIINTDSLSSQKLLQIQGLTSGDNVLQLFYRDSLSESSQLTDIVAIPSGPVLRYKHYNEHTCIEGLTMKYVAPFENGFWYSSDPDTVTIDSVSGDAVLKKVGTSNILYGLSNTRNMDGHINKNVLISNELTVMPANRLSLKVTEGFIPSSNYSCSKTRCIPISLNYQSNSLMAAVYVQSSSMKYNEIDSDSKFDKEHTGILPQTLSVDFPIECSADFDVDDDSVFRHDLLSSLFKVELLAVHGDYDYNLGIRQWACHLIARSIDSLPNGDNDLVPIIQSLRSDLRVHLRARLRYSGLKSASVTVPVVFGYVLLMADESRHSLSVRSSGEVLTDIKLVLAPATKRLLDENKKFILSVVSNKPNLLEVLTPRQSTTDSGVWVYPLKAVVVNKETIDKVEITISFPLTKQVDKILVNINIVGRLADDRKPRSIASQSSILSQVNWIQPVLCVLFTAIIAVLIVMLVNYFLRPHVDEDDLISSPGKDISKHPYNTSFSPLLSPLASARTTQHIWNNPTKKDSSPMYTDYGMQRTNRYSGGMSRL